MIVSTAVACMALNVYHEARGESVPAQYAVALVTMNRANWKPSEICNVVFEKGQFSWTAGAKKTSAGWSVPKRFPIDDKAWEIANKVARITVAGNVNDFTYGATHFHATYVRPDWSKGRKPVKKIDRHIFYRL